MQVKKIHYCWLGGNPKPDIVDKCMESWKKYCPDYEIIEWNENNFDVHCCKYVEEAYLAKKWAFVSDYCRFWILNNYGGVYLDTDVEIIKPLDDLPDTFVGFENGNTIASGLIRAAKPDDMICKRMLHSYHKDIFIKEDGEFNLRTVCERETGIFRELGLKCDGSKQEIEGTIIFPSDYFCPRSLINEKIEITENTYSIHHYQSSWYSEEEKYALALRKKFCKFLPRKFAARVANFFAQCKYRGFFKACKRTLKKLKK